MQTPAEFARALPGAEARSRAELSVAIFHLSVKTISRGAGRSATAAAAYRAGVEIVDERTNEVHDYTRRSGVESAELVLPAGAPAWDRSTLWNAAEAAEKRERSTVAREFEIALPAELSAEDRRSLALAFAQELAARHGVAVDVAVHAPGREGDSRNHHAHVLTSTRRLGPDGFTEKARELDDRKTGPALVHEWRARWAELTNAALERAGRSERIDHRSLAAQGVERAPTAHLGPAATAMERRGERTRIGDENRAVVVDLAERRALVEEQRRVAAELAAHDALVALPLAELQRRAAAVQPRGLGELVFEMQPKARELERAVREAATRKVEAERERERASAERAAWTQAHPVRAWLHARGWWRSRDVERIDVAEAGASMRIEAERAAIAGVHAEVDALKPGWQREAQAELGRRQAAQEPLQAAIADRVRLDAEQAERVAAERHRMRMERGDDPRPKGRGLER